METTDAANSAVTDLFVMVVILVVAAAFAAVVVALGQRRFGPLGAIGGMLIGGVLLTATLLALIG